MFPPSQSELVKEGTRRNVYLPLPTSATKIQESFVGILAFCQLLSVLPGPQPQALKRGAVGIPALYDHTLVVQKL